MARHRVPTARFLVCDSAERRSRSIASRRVRLSGGAEGRWSRRGKGRRHCRGPCGRGGSGARTRWSIGDSATPGDRVVLEEFLVGEEASYFVLADGTSFVPLVVGAGPQAHLRRRRGPEHGRHGRVCAKPARHDRDVERACLDEIVRPVLDGMEAEGHPYRGFLYVGLMLTADGPKVIEFNVRFGDPEAQVVLPMLDEDLSWLLGAAATGALPSRAGAIPRRAARRRRARRGRLSRRRPETGKPIAGLAAAAAVPGALVFHAGTAKRDGQIVTAGGRVLTVVGRGPSIRRGDRRRVRAASPIHFDGMQFRRDIGRKALRRSRSCQHEVLGRHVRLPGQPGGLARDRGRAARARRRRRRRPNDADSLIVNTCSVTATRTRARARRSAASRATNPTRTDRRDRLLCDAAAGRALALCRTSRVSFRTRTRTRSVEHRWRTTSM